VWREHSFVRYDIRADRWIEVEGVPAPPAEPSGTVHTIGDPSSLAVMVGVDFFGWSGPGHRGLLEGVQYLDDSGKWRRLSPITGSRSGITASEKRLYVGIATGQFDDTGEEKPFQVLEYTPGAEQFDELPSPGIARRHFTFLHWTGEEVLVWGGFGSSEAFLDGVVYRPW
jgi:hypothetical protein